MPFGWGVSDREVSSHQGWVALRGRADSDLLVFCGGDVIGYACSVSARVLTDRHGQAVSLPDTTPSDVCAHAIPASAMIVS